MPPPKFASKASAYVRGIADRLRSIEGRLDHGCSSRWLKDLAAVEDLSSIAQLLLPLQSAAQLSFENGWLEQLSARDLTEDEQSDFSRRLMRRLEEVDRAVSAARKPTDMLGEVVLKHFDGHGTFMGTIIEFDATTGFRLQVACVRVCGSVRGVRGVRVLAREHAGASR